jgi:hypothetical protein
LFINQHQQQFSIHYNKNDKYALFRSGKNDTIPISGKAIFSTKDRIQELEYAIYERLAELRKDISQGTMANKIGVKLLAFLRQQQRE